MAEELNGGASIGSTLLYQLFNLSKEQRRPWTVLRNFPDESLGQLEARARSAMGRPNVREAAIREFNKRAQARDDGGVMPRTRSRARSARPRSGRRSV